MQRYVETIRAGARLPALLFAAAAFASCAMPRATEAQALKPQAKVERTGKGLSKSCETLNAAMVFFGEEITRNDVGKRLDEAVQKWLLLPANAGGREVERNVTCAIFISWLNEYECKGAVKVCRSAKPSPRPKSKVE
jgi:hypothetical protein